MSLLDVRAIYKTFGTTRAVDGVSLAIEAGDIVCLLGPSGCGKTTLLRLIAGLETADTGEIWFEGREIAAVPPHQRGFGMMFQEFALFPHKTVFENIAFGLKMRGDTAADVQARVNEMLTLVDLGGLGGRDISQLSGGQQQRVALARALAPSPRLLMLDEPLGALDRALREKLMVELRRILKGVGVTAVYVTHDQTEAFAIADKIVVMNHGRIEQMAPPEVVYTRPRTPFVAQFLGFENILPGQVTADGIRTAIGILKHFPPSNSSSKAVVLIRPDAAVVGSLNSGLQVSGIIESITFRGRYYEFVAVINGQKLAFEVDTAEGLIIGRERVLTLSVDDQHLHIWFNESHNLA